MAAHAEKGTDPIFAYHSYDRNVHAYWEETRLQPVRTVLATLPPDQLEQLHYDLVTDVAGLATDTGI